jgi:hypothetical protein
MVAILALVVSYNVAYAGSYSIVGSGAAVTNGTSPKMYQSIFRMTLSNQSAITRGMFLVYRNSTYLHAYILPQNWIFSYNSDGSFHGQGQTQSTQGQYLNVALDGNRIFATDTDSMWKVSADIHDMESAWMQCYR